MLNVGLYLDDCPLEKGGVRIYQAPTSKVFPVFSEISPMFFNHNPDPREVPLVVRRGDLTIHDGRAWHRTAKVVVTGESSRRRTMYMAWIDEPYDPRDESSQTPLFKRSKTGRIAQLSEHTFYTFIKCSNNKVNNLTNLLSKNQNLFH